jgi:hypothetical protein
MVFKFLCCLVMEKIEVKVWLASMKTLTNVYDLTENPLQKLLLRHSGSRL